MSYIFKCEKCGDTYKKNSCYLCKYGTKHQHLCNQCENKAFIVTEYTLDRNLNNQGGNI